MPMPIVLIADRLSPVASDLLSHDFEVRRCDGSNRDELMSAITDVDAVLVRSAAQVDAETIMAGRRLKVIGRAGVGTDNIDVSAAAAAGVRVVNAPTSNIVSVAELTVALILASARRIVPADTTLRRGRWDRAAFIGTELHGKTVGVIGFGRVGRLVAERLRAFGVRLLAYDCHVAADTIRQGHAEPVSLDELLTRSDFITLHVTKTADTINLIDEAALRRVKPSVRIINTSRGGIVDENALATAIKDGRVAGAGIDVFAIEPATESPLFDLDSVVVTPHIAASTAEAQEKAAIAVAESLRDVLSPSG